MQILGLLGMYFDAAVVFVTKSPLLFRLAVAILWSFELFVCYLNRLKTLCWTIKFQLKRYSLLGNKNLQKFLNSRHVVFVDLSWMYIFAYRFIPSNNSRESCKNSFTFYKYFREEVIVNVMRNADRAKVTSMGYWQVNH